MNNGGRVGFLVFVVSISMLAVGTFVLMARTDVADPSLLGESVGRLTAFVLVLSVVAAALWSRLRALSVIAAIASLVLGSGMLWLPSLIAPPTSARPADLSEAERAEPRRELRDGERWAVQPALQFEMPEPPGLHRVDVPRDGRGVMALVSAPLPEDVLVWRWTNTDATRSVLVAIDVAEGRGAEASRGVDVVLAAFTRGVTTAHPAISVSDEHGAPLDRTVTFHDASEGWSGLARAFGYELESRTVTVLIVAAAAGDLRSLRAVVRSARHRAPTGATTFAAAPTTGGASSAPSGARVAGPWAVTGAGAFDLVVDAEGTLVAWAEPAERGGMIRALELGSEGEAIGVPRELAASGGHVRELAIARRGARTAVAWITTDGRAGEVRASIVEPAGDAATVVSLGDARASSASARGDLAIAALPEGTFVVASRGAGTRSAIALFELGGPRRRIDPIPLAAPCEKAVLGAIATAEGAMLSLCAGEPGAEEWVVARLGGHGAAAGALERRALGCAPIGIAPGEPMRVVDRCADTPRVTALDGTSSAVASADPVPCEGERPSLGVPLESITDHLEPMLPSTVAPTGARVVWTRDALLVATRLGPELVIQRRQCQAGALLRTDL